MAIETSPNRSRRAILAGAAGGVAAAVVAGLSGPLVVTATGGNVTLGGPNSATDVTAITNTATDGSAFLGTASGTGTGISGVSGTGTAIGGNSGTGYGVAGYNTSNTHPGVLGVSGRNPFNDNTSNTGVQGFSGILFDLPAPPQNTGVYGSSQSGDGVVGNSDAHRGVSGTSGSGVGVYGATVASNLPAIRGVSFGDGTGVHGHSGPSSPTTSPANTGVYGFATGGSGGVGVRGKSADGRGGVFEGSAAQVKLVASTAATHPGSGQRGDLFVDNQGRLWFCKAGSTWVQLA